MNGIDSSSGKALSGIAHLKQSISDILTTRIGTRVMRREYGSRLPALIDAPTNADTVLEIFAATAEALERWEPRFRLFSVSISSAQPGKLILDLSGEYLPEGKPIKLDGVVVQ